MCPADDIPNETPSSQTERDVKREGQRSRRSIGPESEERGGPEAVDGTLGEGSDRDGGTRPQVNKRGDR